MQKNPIKISELEPRPSVNNKGGLKNADMTPEVPFKAVMEDVMSKRSATASPNTPQVAQNVPSPLSNTQVPTVPLSRDAAILAQAVNAGDLNIRSPRRRRNTNNPTNAEPYVDRTPYQIFIDQAVQVLDRISQQEARVNELTNQYIAGNVSIDDVSIEASKLNMSITFITTVITTAATTLKELTGMQI
jgi:flagellar hook-basal body complex protein FliE